MRLKTGSAVNQVTPMLIMHSLASRLEPGYSCSKSGATWMGVGWERASELCSITDLPGNYFPAYYVTQRLSTPIAGVTHQMGLVARLVAGLGVLTFAGLVLVLRPA